MDLVKVSLLFAVTAVAEIVGCYLPWLVLGEHKSAWLHWVEGVTLTRWDIAGAAVAFAGMAIIVLQPAVEG